MKIKLTDVPAEAGGRILVSGDIAAENFSYHGDEYEFISPLHFEGVLTNNGKELVLTGSAKADFYANCARCLEKTRQSICYDVEEVYVRESETDASDGEMIVITGDEIEPDDVIMSGFYVNAPSKYLCGDDCKGLCPECGANLNKGDCGCDKEQIDPRWEALKKIMDSRNDS